MSTPLGQGRRLQAGALLAPLIVVQAASWLLGGGPAAAPAATPDPPLLLDALLTPPRSAPSDEHQQRCLAYLAASVTARPLRSPMAHDEVPEPPPIMPITAPAEQTPEAPALLPAPVLTLTALLNNRTGGMAAIDGKIARPGDTVAPGWQLAVIDHTDERILITSEDGQRVWIPLPRDLPR